MKSARLTVVDEPTGGSWPINEAPGYSTACPTVPEEPPSCANCKHWEEMTYKEHPGFGPTEPFRHWSMSTPGEWAEFSEVDPSDPPNRWGLCRRIDGGVASPTTQAVMSDQGDWAVVIYLHTRAEFGCLCWEPCQDTLSESPAS